MTEVMDIHIQEAQQTPNRIHLMRSTSKWIIVKLLTLKETENVESYMRDVTFHVQRILNKVNSRFFIRDHEDQKAGDDILKVLK